MAEPQLAPGVLVQERYRIIRAAGKGGMGAVYEAIDERLGHRVALKQTLVEGDVGARAFEREARLLASLRHPALPVVSDFFADGPDRFLVMQFIPGQTLAELAQERAGPFPVDQVLHWAEVLLEALEHLHSRQPPILHRDIKPANLKLTADGEVVLLDFGLAKGSGDTTSSGPSVYGLTPQYAPLEQFHGAGTVPASDLYSLGATLYFLLTHETPPDALTRASHVGMGKPDPLPAPRARNAEIPLRVAAWLTRALALHKEDRYQSARVMARELTEIRSGITEAEPPATVPTGMLPTVAGPAAAAPARARRSRGLLLAGLLACGLLLTVVIAGALWVAWRNRQPVSGPPGTRIELAEGEGFELLWPGKDYWKLQRGKEDVSVHAGTAGAEVPPGTYRIAPLGDAVFEPVEFAVRAGRKTIVSLPAGRFLLKWPAKDYWKLLRETKAVGIHEGTAGRDVAPGRYRIEPNSDAVFEPLELTVEEGKTTVVNVPSGTFELQWAGKDYWKLFREEKSVALHEGTERRVVAPGRYRIEPNSEAVFDPVELTVEEGKTTVVNVPSGTFEFQWAGKDYWKLFRGGKVVTLHTGTMRRVVAPGRYRIEPNSEAVFEPIELTVEEGKTAYVAAPSGTFEFQWPGQDYWKLSRGGTSVASHQGTAGRPVMPGTYRIEPNDERAFAPVEFTVEEGRHTVVRAKPR